MRFVRCWSVCAAASAVFLIQPLAADTYQLILRGKVTMLDGSPPPKSVGIERVCSDEYGNAPGPPTNKNGEYLWRMEVDPMRTRTCRIRANLPGYSSTEIDISALNSYSDPKLPPLVLSARGANPNAIEVNNSEVPAKSLKEWKAAMESLSNLPEATQHMENAVKASPKFPLGWNALGQTYEKRSMYAESRDAFQHAIEQDPKFLAAYLNLAKVSLKAKDWDTAAKACDSLLKADKRVFPEIYLHQAVAKYQLKDLAGAQASAEEAIRVDQIHRMPRAEYVLGRILQARGDAAGAREHIMKYLELAPNAPDVVQIQAQLADVSKPDAGADIPLELL